MSSSPADQNTSATTHLKSTFQELKRSMVDNATTRGDSFKSTTQPLKDKKTDSTVRKGGDNSKGAVGGK